MQKLDCAMDMIQVVMKMVYLLKTSVVIFC